MSRVADWYSRYVKMIAEIRHVPFAWHTNDCGPSFVGRHVHNLTGNELPLEYKPYKSMRGAVRAMKEIGADNLADAVAKYLPEIHPSMAQMGDIVAVPDNSPFGYALGVVNGDRIFVKREDGLGTVDLLEAERAFRV